MTSTSSSSLLLFSYQDTDGKMLSKHHKYPKDGALLKSIKSSLLNTLPHAIADATASHCIAVLDRILGDMLNDLDADSASSISDAKPFSQLLDEVASSAPLETETMAIPQPLASWSAEKVGHWLAKELELNSYDLSTQDKTWLQQGLKVGDFCVQ